MKAVHVTVLILACGYTGIVPLEAGQVCLQVLFCFILFIRKMICPRPICSQIFKSVVFRAILQQSKLSGLL